MQIADCAVRPELCEVDEVTAEPEEQLAEQRPVRFHLRCDYRDHVHGRGGDLEVVGEDAQQILCSHLLSAFCPVPTDRSEKLFAELLRVARSFMGAVVQRQASHRPSHHRHERVERLLEPSVVDIGPARQVAGDEVGHGGFAPLGDVYALGVSNEVVSEAA